MSMTRAEKRESKRLRRDLPRMRGSDVVVGVLPDGSTTLIKGYAFLHAVIANDATRAARIDYVPVSEVELAVALEDMLGKDGAFYNQPVAGHA